MKNELLLDKYSLTGMSSELESSIVKSRFILGQMVLTGQASVFYASPNTGKTLITLHLIMEASRIDLSNLYFLNLDDTSEGLLQKLKIAEDYGFRMLSIGYKSFKASDFKMIIEDMIKNDQCKGVIIIADTLKKLTDLMNKKSNSDFNNLIRCFVLLGGTFLGLAHVNKKPDSNGKPVYVGTSDTIDDFDNAYIIHKVRDEKDYRYVQFQNLKDRSGITVPLATYRYSSERNLTYNELLLSVEHFDIENEKPFYDLNEDACEAMKIDVVQHFIKRGFNTKMLLVSEVAKNLSISKRRILKFVEERIGVYWDFTVGEHNANIFFVLEDE